MARHTRPKHDLREQKESKQKSVQKQQKDFTKNPKKFKASEKDAAVTEKKEKKIPRTVENSRKPSETLVRADDEEIKVADSMDEFASFFAGSETPKILITTSRHPVKVTREFAEELSDVLPNSQFVARPLKHLIKDVIAEAVPRGFTHLCIISDNLKQLESLIIVKLPEGPTAYFHLTSFKSGKELSLRARSTCHHPELILNNFTSRLGHTIGRMFVSLFPPIPEFHGRQAATFHNQRDFIFFRRHRYIFDDQGKRVNVQEIGPRFTLKLEALQKGTFDRRSGEFELSHRASNAAARTKTFIL
jgi:ribosome production factor 1